MAFIPRIVLISIIFNSRLRACKRSLHKIRNFKHVNYYFSIPSTKYGYAVQKTDIDRTSYRFFWQKIYKLIFLQVNFLSFCCYFSRLFDNKKRVSAMVTIRLL